MAVAAAIPLTMDQKGRTPYLQFGSNEKFSITVFSDLHLGESKFHHKLSPQRWLSSSLSEDKVEADRKTIGVMNSILDYEKPNVVVLNGDLITCDDLTTGDATLLIDQITAPLVHRNIPFAATFGNHDYVREMQHARHV